MLANISPVLAQAMALPDSISVSETGGAIQNFPIAVPPGTAGVVPSLQLTYNSQGQNGIVGMGFNLNGLAAIGRCPRTFATDGVRGGGVNFDANDRFCLDGQRLIAISGSDGADGTEYRTEIESFTKVISHGSAGTGPAWFEVRTKSGQVMEFGNSTDSRILATGKAEARSWAVNKVADTKGNYFTVSYVNDTANGQAYPSRIDYTGNAGAGLAPYNSVRFVYNTARPDVITAYQVGSLIRTTALLTNIQTYAGNSLVSDYRLAYSTGPATGRMRLHTVTLCDGGGTCLPATTIGWTSGGTGTLSFTEFVNPIATTDFSVSGGAAFTGDWNGDGITDVMRRDTSSGDNVWFVSNGALGFTKYQQPIPPANVAGGTLYFGDWNGDGLTDLMWWDRSGGSNRWYINNGVVNGSLSFTEYVNPITPSDINRSNGFLYTGDWNADGVTDILVAAGGNGANDWFINNKIVDGVLSFTKYASPIAPANISGGSTIFFGDWNGDGITDAMWWGRGNGHNNWFISNGAVGGSLSFTTIIDPIPPNNFTNTNNGTSINFGDWNGDGLTDVMWWGNGSGHNNWFINKGFLGGTLSFTATIDLIAGGNLDGGTALFTGDWNGDGLTDIMWWGQGSGYNNWFINTPTASGSLSFTPIIDPITRAEIDGGVSLFFGDWKGNGIAHLMWWGGNNGTNNWFVNNNTPPDVLNSVTNGLGAQTSITYTPMTDPSAYTKDTGANAASYPVVDIQGPMQVTSRLEQSDGVGGTRVSTYHYAGAKMDLSGRGFLGFRQMTATDQQTGIQQTSVYNQSYPLDMMKQSDTRSLNGVVLSNQTNSYGSASLGGTRYRVFLNQSVATGADLDGTALPSTTTSYQYDAFNNATQITVTTSDGFSKTTTNTYSNDTANWLLGRLNTATVTAQAP